MITKEELILKTRQAFTESIAKYLDGETVSIQLFHVNSDLTYIRYITKMAGYIETKVKVKEVGPKFRTIIFTITFDKYEHDFMLYTARSYTLETIIENFFSTATEIVRKSFIDDNNLERVLEINKSSFAYPFFGDFTPVNPFKLNNNE